MAEKDAMHELVIGYLERNEANMVKVMERITVLEVKTDGFGRRFDIANGRTAKNEDAIQDLRIGYTSVIGKLASLDKFAENANQEGNKIKAAIIDKGLWVLGSVILGFLLNGS